MKIVFHTLKYRNFLAVGNAWVEIQLDRKSKTMIVGSNGSGKTTIIDAFIFALFGKAFRNINKPKLVNSINGQDCLVELTFSISNKKYRIVRGIKPAIFEIYVDGKMIDQNAGIKDYQGYLEKNILRFNYKACVQVIVLGSKSYIPFMKLVAADRRAVVEDILDMQIYSSMSVTIKKKLDIIKDEINQSQIKIDLIKERIKIQTKLVQELANKNQQTIDKNNSDIETTKEEIKLLENANFTLQTLKKKFDENLPFKSKLQEMFDIQSKLNHRMSILHKEIHFFNDNEICPTCHRDLDKEFRVSEVDIREEKYKILVNGYDSLSKQINELKKQIEERDNIVQYNKSLDNKTNDNFKSIERYENWIEKLNNENYDIKNNSEDISKNKKILEDFKIDFNGSLKLHSELMENKKYWDCCITILKDNGIKASLIKQYIPLINNYINKYLSYMDFFVNFSLDEQFEESIYSRFRDEFSYENFSEGEKLRLDLAILFAWRSVAKIKNSIDTNLLIMDEILDSSLDVAGIDDFFKLMQGLQGNDTNMFIISHQGDVLTDKFNNMIKFCKRNNFSEIEE